MKKIFLSIILLTLFICTINSQESFFAINYTPSLPLGQTSSYIEDFSWRGIGFEHRHYLNPMLTLGISFGWQTYNKKLEGYLDDIKNVSIYGNQYRNINTFPIMANIHYHVWPEKYLRPYFGGGIGAYNIHQVTEMGPYTLTKRSWKFGLAPEVGVLYDISPEINLVLGLVYNYGIKTSDSDSYSAVNLKIGIVWVRL